MIYSKNKFFLTGADQHYMNIMWIPCGRDRVCHGKTSGIHFLIKYRYAPKIKEFLDSSV